MRYLKALFAILAVSLTHLAHATVLLENQTITYGSITVGNQRGDGYYDFGGDNFSVQGSIDRDITDSARPCPICHPGDLVGVFSGPSGSDMNFYHLNVLGVQYPLFAPVSVFATGPNYFYVGVQPFVLEGPGTVTVPFSLSAGFCDSLITEAGRPCDVKLSVTGHGFAEFVFVDRSEGLSGGVIQLALASGVYTFVPEPATLGLLGLGLIGLGFTRRKQTT